MTLGALGERELLLTATRNSERVTRNSKMTWPPEQRNAREFTVGLVQMSCLEEPERNRAKALDGVRAAAAQGAQIVCLQELFSSPYFCQTEDARFFDLAEPIPGPTTEALSQVARDLGVVLIVPLFERRAPGLFHNSAAVIDWDGRLLGVYRKMHIPDDPLYYEKFYFTPGDLGYLVFETHFARLAVLICWDQWYPEAARLSALRGAEILFYPSAIGWVPAERQTEGPAQHDAWRTIQRGHAIANGVYVAAVNRVGHEGQPDAGLDFWGQSFVCGPQGEILAEASSDQDDVLTAACSRELLENYRRGWPFFRDRRIDTYGPITQRFIDGSAGRETVDFKP